MSTAPTPRASILVPTHDKPATLPIAVASALAQTVTDLEVIIIGDGVVDAMHDAVRPLLADPRVRFLDLPKGPHHGEVHRHTAILEARSDAIFYLCDDDLLLRDHVGDLLALLDGRDLVQCWNGLLQPDGTARLYPTNLADPAEGRRPPRHHPGVQRREHHRHGAHPSRPTWPWTTPGTPPHPGAGRTTTSSAS